MNEKSTKIEKKNIPGTKQVRMFLRKTINFFFFRFLLFSARSYLHLLSSRCWSRRCSWSGGARRRRTGSPPARPEASASGTETESGWATCSWRWRSCPTEVSSSAPSSANRQKTRGHCPRVIGLASPNPTQNKRPLGDADPAGVDVRGRQAGVGVDVGQAGVGQQQRGDGRRCRGLALALGLGLGLLRTGRLHVHQARRPLPLGGYLGENAVRAAP